MDAWLNFSIAIATEQNVLFYILYAGSATLVCPATSAVYIMHKSSTILLRLIHITIHVDFGV